MDRRTVAEIVANREEQGFPPIGSGETLLPLIQVALELGENGSPLLRYLHDASALISIMSGRLLEPRSTT